MLKRLGKFLRQNLKLTWSDCLKTVLGLFLATICCIGLHSISGGEDTSYLPVAQSIYLLATFLISLFTRGFLYGIFTAVSSMLLTNYIFTYPFLAFNFSLPGYPVVISATLIVSITTSIITTLLNTQSKLRLEAESEKMRSNLLRAVSHDLRTPLTSIMGASSAIIENGDSFNREEESELVKEIYSDAERLLGMVENLLSITKLDGQVGENLEKTPEAVEEVVGEAVSQFRRRFPDREVLARVPDDLILVPMNAMLIKQVLLNLLENVQFHTPIQAQARLLVFYENQQVGFCVSDNGNGIPPQHLGRIFQGLFQKTQLEQPDTQRGMGIGLSVCNNIVKAHGGKMTATNLPSGGAAFTFWLPLEE